MIVCLSRVKETYVHVVDEKRIREYPRLSHQLVRVQAPLVPHSSAPLVPYSSALQVPYSSAPLEPYTVGAPVLCTSDTFDTLYPDSDDGNDALGMDELEFKSVHRQPSTLPKSPLFVLSDLKRNERHRTPGTG